MSRTLAELAARCKCGIYVEVNAHRDYYQSAEEELASERYAPDADDIPADIRTEMVATNTIVRVQAYPRTPIGFYVTYHYDVDKAITEMHALLDAEGVA